MLTRIITAVVALAVFIIVLLAGETAFEIGICAVILFMLYEVYGALTRSKAVKASGYLTGVLLMVSSYFGKLEIGLVLAVMSAMVFLIFLHERVKYSEMFSVSLMSVYITLFMSYIPRLYSEMGLFAMLIVFIVAWGSDTAAYFSGTFFGKHKLIPKVSPKKTVEGSLGAVVTAALLCVLYAFILNKCNVLPTDVAVDGIYLRYALLGLTASVLSQLGDLAASAVKRDAGIKDYGKIFPGHGGFVDRFDSVIFISPAVYYLLQLIIM